MKRRTFFVLASVALIGTAAYFYIDTVFLPVQFKHFITAKASHVLRRNVSIGDIDFRPIQGFILENVTVAQRDSPDEPFVQIRRATFNILLVPIFRKKAVIIPNIKIEGPVVTLVRDENRVWNFSDLTGLPGALRHKSLYPVLMRKLIITGGRVHYTDKTLTEKFHESFERINLDAILSLNKGVRFEFKAQAPRQKSIIRIKGGYALIDKKLTAQIQIDNVDIARYLPLLYTSAPYISLSGGIISSGNFGVIHKDGGLQIRGSLAARRGDIRVGQNTQITGEINVPSVLVSWRDKKWNAQGRLRVVPARIKTGQDTEFLGDLAADLNLLTIFGKNMTCQGNVRIDSARLAIGQGTSFTGNVNALNASLARQDGRIVLQGNFDIKDAAASLGPDASLSGNVTTNSTQLTWAADESGHNRLDAQGGVVVDDARIFLAPEKSVSGNIRAHKTALTYAGGKITIEADGQIEKTDFRFGDKRRFQGNPFFNIFYQHDKGHQTPADYRGIVHLKDSQLSNIPLLGDLSAVNGTVKVTPRYVQTDALTFNAQQTDFLISGKLTNFSNPDLDLSASSKNISLRKVLSLFPALREKIKVNLTGQAAVGATYRGPGRSPSKAVIELTAQLKDAAVTHPKFYGDITGVSGRLDYTKDLLIWRNLNGTYQGTAYILNGRLTNFSRPVVDTTVRSDELDVTVQLKILRSAFQLTTLAGSYLHSSFDLKGDVHLFPDAEADIDLRGKGALDLQDAGRLLGPFGEKFNRWQPRGTLNAEGIFKGKLADRRNWQLALTGASQRILLNNHPLEEVTFRFTQRDQTISKCDIFSRIYGGELKIISVADLRETQTPFSANINISNLDLARLRKTQNLKNTRLAGTLTLSSVLQGFAAQPGGLTGYGSLQITNGYLWQWNILSGIATAILIPEFKNIIFTDASVNFTVREKKILSDNARMKSESVTLDGKGWLDFDRNLNFAIIPTFSKLTIIQSDSLKKGPTSLVTQTKGYLNIKLTGTLDHPVTHVEKFPLRIIGETIGGTTRTIKEVIGGIAEEIF